MNLREYLEREKISPSAWAKKVGIPQPVISRFLSGERGVSLATALRIQEVTDGLVRVEDMVKPDNGNEPELEAQSA